MNSIVEASADHLQSPCAGSQLSIQLMQAQDAARWDQFVLECPEASFFHRAGWQSVIERAFGHKTWFFFAEAEGKIVGVLPLAEIKSALFGHSLSSLPFCVYGGVATESDAARVALTLAAQALASKLKVGHLEYRNVKASAQEGWHTKELYVTFRKEIDPDEEKNMLAIPRKQRAMVRKGIKFELKSELDEGIERFFHAYSSSVHRLGTPVFSKKFFRLLKETFGKDCEVMTIVKDERIIASVMSFYFRDEVLPYYGGGTAEARDLAGNDFMYWELMRRACARGYKVFDFGRSKLGTGAFDFKKNWGFEPQPLHYTYQLHQSTAVPDNNPLNPKYQLFIKMWQRLPLPVANLIGPHIVKNLG
ncbi:FemAB family XrtA/PEP-CTERM system-associated protein [Undibacterium sp.]|jgi:FemAB-related protein (PEP-CTERM system-associated)|uniref:FemAB family XrtA/PEP-CTERM system-associated protein n=1 Tax=Undibacterium sp. TaxID=1914977 RepID=UPI002B8A04A4|nr:FemAB family XrtA/PEP-CTERM system-associated protein [Undibacterium sp.]HTD05571.1 FemAB family XrtA/PEP-CTERM system-associated protein [Undibacterium sp.]